MMHDHPLTFSVVPNDKDYDSSSIQIPANGFTQPAHGTVTLNTQTGAFTYTPAAGFVGTDTFTYKVNDGYDDSKPATVAVDVTNAVPVAAPALYDFGMQSNLQRAATVDGRFDTLTHEHGLIASDADGDAISFAVKTDPEHGSVEINHQTGDFTYTPGAGFFGVDHFSYVASDGVTASLPAQITITSFGENSPLMPAARNITNSIIYNNNNQTWGEIAFYLPFLSGPSASSSISMGLVQAPVHGTLALEYHASTGLSAHYTPAGDFAGHDEATVTITNGAVVSKPIQLQVEANINGGLDVIRPLRFSVKPDEATTYSYLYSGLVSNPQTQAPTISQGAGHGTVTFNSDAGFTYTPSYDPEDEESQAYIGWDLFSYTAPGSSAAQWVQLDVGGEVTQASGPVTLQPPAATVATTYSFNPTLAGLTGGFNQATNLLRDMLSDIATLGEGVKNIAAPTVAQAQQILDKLDLATAPVERIAENYDKYVGVLAGLAKAAGAALASQSWWQLYKGDINALVTKINALPTKIGSLSTSNARMKELAQALKDQGEGAGVAVDTAKRMVEFAEDTHKVLTAVQAIGGVGAIAQVGVETGISILTQKTFTACVKKAAVETGTWLASATASAVANYALDSLDLDPQTRNYIQLGLDVFQIVCFFKAARAKLSPGSQCFVAGTQVVTGINPDGSYATKNIEDIKKTDRVLSRDQYNESDDLSLHEVTETFAHTVDHIRVVTIRDTNGKTQVIRTTDTHPFYVEGKGWIEAGDLTAGQRLNEADDSNDATVVSSVREEYPEGITVYNFTVEGDHTYYVEDREDSTTAVWVHNDCRGILSSANAVVKKRSDLRKALGLMPGDGKEAHHLIPIEALKAENAEVAQAVVKATKAGFEFNGTENGLALDAMHGIGTNTSTHASYNADVIAEIRERISLGKIFDESSAKAQITGVTVMFRQKIADGLYW